jgi:O-antigen/teichoic acid export membrane protein
MNWIGLGLKMIVSFFLLPFIVRHLGTESYGEYAVLVALFGYSAVLDLGFRAAILRYGALFSSDDDTPRLNAVLGTIFIYYLAVALIVVALGVTLYYVAPKWIVPEGSGPHFTLYMLLFSIVAATFFFRIGWKSVLCARERYDLSNAVDISAFFLRTLIIVAALELGYGIEALIAADIVENLAVSIGHRQVLRRLFPRLKLDWAGARGSDRVIVARYSLWAFLNSLSNNLRFRAPSLVIAWTLTTTDVAFYNIAARLQSYLMQLTTAMSSPFRPRFSALQARDEWDELTRLFIRGTRWISIFALGTTGILFIYADRFILAWMGPGFEPGVIVLRILMLGLCVELGQMLTSGLLYAIGRHQLLSAFALFEATFILLGGILLVKGYGLMGVAMSVSAPIILNKVIFQPLYVCHVLKLPVGRYVKSAFLKPALAGMISLAVVFVMYRILPGRGLPQIGLQMLMGLILHAGAAWLIALEDADRDRVALIARRYLPRPDWKS